MKWFLAALLTITSTMAAESIDCVCTIDPGFPIAGYNAIGREVFDSTIEGLRQCAAAGIISEDELQDKLLLGLDSGVAAFDQTKYDCTCDGIDIPLMFYNDSFKESVIELLTRCINDTE